MAKIFYVAMTDGYKADTDDYWWDVLGIFTSNKEAKRACINEGYNISAIAIERFELNVIKKREVV